MFPRVALAAFSVGAMLLAASAFAQSGIYLPKRGEPGLDPAFARGWLASDYDLSGFSSQRPQWSYSFGGRSSLGMALNNGRDLDPDGRQMSVFGRYWLNPSWGFSAETLSQEPGGLLRLQDLRFGVQRRF
jgi:hypothetical protein